MLQSSMPRPPGERVVVLKLRHKGTQRRWGLRLLVSHAKHSEHQRHTANVELNDDICGCGKRVRQLRPRRRKLEQQSFHAHPAQPRQTGCGWKEAASDSGRSASCLRLCARVLT